ncbi:MAG: lysine--tRNA ligase, partial [Alphaproteobacteria bacterium]|nr:lysine--tRNA ligase [Alphaproteobacteria bacterium]
ENSRTLAQTSMAWPFEEARKILDRLQGKTPEKGFVLFETGYGPSGLPHIGTFGEVARTTMVRQAFSLLSDISTKLYAVSDDMDGLRKIPDNIPNGEMVREHLGKPLTQIPDPFGTHQSFGHHNNARLCAFLDAFGFEYEFVSASECYTSGRFDPMLLSVLAHYEAIISVILPTLGPERRATYSPFLPVCAETGRVLQVSVVERDEKAGTIVYKREDGKLIETKVTGGHCKLQWKADWGMRWAAFDVDYEMSGKDLIDSVKLSSQICRILGHKPPEGFNYELFLDVDGTKISKSKGNGLTMEEWLQYAPEESLAYFMYQSPRKAKRLYFDVIPRAVDEYLNFLEKFPTQPLDQKMANPAWHVHDGKPPKEELPLTFGILLNLASVTNTEDKKVLWGFISRYAKGATPESMPMVDRLVGYAIAYYRDFVKPHKHYRTPTAEERKALEGLDLALKH